jgi:hypothetical protein
MLLDNWDAYCHDRHFASPPLKPIVERNASSLHIPTKGFLYAMRNGVEKMHRPLPNLGNYGTIARKLRAWNIAWTSIFVEDCIGGLVYNIYIRLKDNAW